MLYVKIGLTEYEGSRTSTNVCLKVTLKWCRLLTKIIFYHLCVSEILTDRCFVLIWIPSDLINTLCWGQRSELKKKNQEIGEYTKYSIKIKKNKNQYWNSESVKRLSQVFCFFVLFCFSSMTRWCVGLTSWNSSSCLWCPRWSWSWSIKGPQWCLYTVGVV